MKFNLLLFILQRKLSKAARSNDAFQRFIRNKCLKIAIKTADDRRGRLFIFNRGRISANGRFTAGADAAMVWNDADTGFKVMANSDDEASLAALADRSLKIEGDFKAFAWFSRALNIMMGKA